MKKMEELGISPTPWNDDTGCIVCKKRMIAVICGSDFEATKEEIANGNIIAAAPDMYNALYNLVHLEKRCLEFSNSGCDGCPLENTDCLNQIMIIVQAAEAALAKASGEEAHQ